MKGECKMNTRELIDLIKDIDEKIREILCKLGDDTEIKLRLRSDGEAIIFEHNENGLSLCFYEED